MARHHFASSCGLGLATPWVVFSFECWSQNGPGSLSETGGCLSSWKLGEGGYLNLTKDPSHIGEHGLAVLLLLSYSVFPQTLLVIQPFQLLGLGVCSTRAKREKLSFGFCMCFPQPCRGTSQQVPGKSSHITVCSSAWCRPSSAAAGRSI